jgi:deoxycytidine triphosphate deaminase
VGRRRCRVILENQCDSACPSHPPRRTDCRDGRAPQAIRHDLRARPGRLDVRINCVDTRFEPGKFMLAATVERFQMPNDLMGIVHDKSTWRAAA